MNSSTFFKDGMTQHTSKNFLPLNANEEYIIHDGLGICHNDLDDSVRNERRLQQYGQNNDFRRSQNSIYLQQVPRISKCNVQFSFEGVYDNENSSDTVLPIDTLRNNTSQDQNKNRNDVSVNYNLCSGFPLSCKLVSALIGLVLVSGAIASWSVVLTKDDSSEGRLNVGCSCLDHVNINGYGNCKKAYKRNNKMLSCYVHEPSTCEDVRNSSTDAGLRFSFEACDNK